MANIFANFYNDNIAKIRSRLDNAVISDLPSQQAQLEEVDDTPVPLVWDEFAAAGLDEVKKIVMSSKSTTCQLDPIPTPLLKVLINILLPLLKMIINMSFDCAHFRKSSSLH